MIPRPGIAGAGTPATTQRSLPMLYAAPAITIYSCCIAALLGACMGSFLNCAAWRVVHGESVLRGRSHCDVCGHVLAPRDLVPVFSYVFSRGRCRYCGAKLSPATRWVKRWPRWCSCRCCCAMISPSGPSKPGPWPACCWPAPSRTWRGISSPTALSRSALCFLSSLCFCPGPGQTGAGRPHRRRRRGRRRPAAGAADGEAAPPRRYGRRRYQAAVSHRAVSGLAENLLCLLLACVVGILWGLVRAKRGQQGLPWGPGIALAAWCAALFGQNLIDWYLSLL